MLSEEGKKEKLIDRIRNMSFPNKNQKNQRNTKGPEGTLTDHFVVEVLDRLPLDTFGNIPACTRDHAWMRVWAKLTRGCEQLHELSIKVMHVVLETMKIYIRSDGEGWRGGLATHSSCSVLRVSSINSCCSFSLQ